MHFAKKLTALFSCLSLLMLHPIALANEECFDLDGVVLSSHSDAEAIRKLTEIRNSMDKFFLAKGGDRIPPRISHEMALDLARFLALEGFTHIQLVGGQPQTQDERNTWEVFGGTILKNSDWDGPKIKKFNAGIKKFFLAKGMREIPASISSEVYLALIDFLVLEGFTKDELIGESDDTEKVPWKIFEHIAFNHSDIQNNPKIKKLKSSHGEIFPGQGRKGDTLYHFPRGLISTWFAFWLGGIWRDETS